MDGVHRIVLGGYTANLSRSQNHLWAAAVLTKGPLNCSVLPGQLDRLSLLIYIRSDDVTGPSVSLTSPLFHLFDHFQYKLNRK